MRELIKIAYNNDKPMVSGRELHGFLEVSTQYKDWFPRMREYGFTEGLDFNPLNFEQVRLEGEREVKRTIVDHQLTVDMAKELCMLQRNEKGKQARQYFIQLEKAWNTPEQVMARALKMANQQLDEAKKAMFQLEQTVEEQRPKALFADAVATAKSTVLVGDLAKILKQNGVEMGQRRLFEWLRENGYLARRRGTEYNMPTQRAMEQGLFEIKETVIAYPDGHTTVSKTPKLTGRGQQYFVSKFLGDKRDSEAV